MEHWAKEVDVGYVVEPISKENTLIKEKAKGTEAKALAAREIK